MKIVINNCHGGFGLSHEAMMLYAKKKYINLVFEEPSISLCPYVYYIDEAKEENHFWYHDIPRDDTELVQVVEELGEWANGRFAKLKIVEIPDDIKWEIEEYDGLEWVSEVHRTWG